MGGETTETAKPKGTYPKLSEKPVGQLIANLYKDRIGQFYGGGQYEHNNLRAYAFSEAVPLFQFLICAIV